MGKEGSINEPGQSRQGFSPRSINEPPVPPDVQAPTVTALEPATCAIGDPDFTLDVTGTGFKDGISVIVFANEDEPTTFNGDTTVSTTVKPSLWASAVTVQCLVRNGPLESAALDFVFTEAVAPPEKSAHVHAADPDELEEEIEEAEEEGEFKPTHKAHSKTTHKRKR